MRTATMYPSLSPVPNHSGPGSTSSTGAHISEPQVKKRMCWSAWSQKWCSAPW